MDALVDRLRPVVQQRLLSADVETVVQAVMGSMEAKRQWTQKQKEKVLRLVRMSANRFICKEMLSVSQATEQCMVLAKNVPRGEQSCQDGQLAQRIWSLLKSDIIRIAEQEFMRISSTLQSILHLDRDPVYLWRLVVACLDNYRGFVDGIFLGVRYAERDARRLPFRLIERLGGALLRSAGLDPLLLLRLASGGPEGYYRLSPFFSSQDGAQGAEGQGRPGYSWMLSRLMETELRSLFRRFWLLFKESIEEMQRRGVLLIPEIHSVQLDIDPQTVNRTMEPQAGGDSESTSVWALHTYSGAILSRKARVEDFERGQGIRVRDLLPDWVWRTAVRNALKIGNVPVRSWLRILSYARVSLQFRSYANNLLTYRLEVPAAPTEASLLKRLQLLSRAICQYRTLSSLGRARLSLLMNIRATTRISASVAKDDRQDGRLLIRSHLTHPSLLDPAVGKILSSQSIDAPLFLDAMASFCSMRLPALLAGYSPVESKKEGTQLVNTFSVHRVAAEMSESSNFLAKPKQDLRWWKSFEDFLALLKDENSMILGSLLLKSLVSEARKSLGQDQVSAIQDVEVEDSPLWRLVYEWLRASFHVDVPQEFSGDCSALGMLSVLLPLEQLRMFHLLPDSSPLKLKLEAFFHAVKSDLNKKSFPLISKLRSNLDKRAKLQIKALLSAHNLKNDASTSTTSVVSVSGETVKLADSVAEFPPFWTSSPSWMRLSLKQRSAAARISQRQRQGQKQRPSSTTGETPYSILRDDVPRVKRWSFLDSTRSSFVPENKRMLEELRRKVGTLVVDNPDANISGLLRLAQSERMKVHEKIALFSDQNDEDSFEANRLAKRRAAVWVED